MITTQDVDRQRKNDNSPHLPTMTGTGTPTGVTMTTTIDCGTKNLVKNSAKFHFACYVALPYWPGSCCPQWHRLRCRLLGRCRCHCCCYCCCCCYCSHWHNCMKIIELYNLWNLVSIEKLTGLPQHWSPSTLRSSDCRSWSQIFLRYMYIQSWPLWSLELSKSHSIYDIWRVRLYNNDIKPKMS